ncbi:hypothetical protein SAMN05216276_108727 [Streptosporangium subroseum]|uniref:Uncharacterized protein n=1 Tax=Streptosporangium subroseum TaxID=106412 RepID=A0A239P5W6_9ACTN|nr:hypothetical protein [Streptosporangium subroseum]SNT62064.1 hypothetical protein SAMN05216276_108727 [Streptosporangium subroseum]
MDTKAPRTPPTINKPVRLAACAAFLRHPGDGLLPGGVEPRPEHSR